MKVNTTQAIKLVQPPDTKTQKPSGKNWERIPQPNAGALTSKITRNTKRNDLNATAAHEHHLQFSSASAALYKI